MPFLFSVTLTQCQHLGVTAAGTQISFPLALLTLDVQDTALDPQLMANHPNVKGSPHTSCLCPPTTRPREAEGPDKLGPHFSLCCIFLLPSLKGLTSHHVHWGWRVGTWTARNLSSESPHGPQGVRMPRVESRLS